MSEKCSEAHVDHIVPKGKGGLNCINNLRIMCAHCNESKNIHHGRHEEYLFGLGADDCRVFQKKGVISYQKKKGKNRK
jgi:hypothetical protein